MINLNAAIIKESIELTKKGASHKDLWTNLFVPKEDFNSWFMRGRDLVDEGYGRLDIDIDDLAKITQLDSFDVLCLLLYRSIIKERWKIKESMYTLVSKSANPNLAFKFMEALYRTEYNPRYAEDESDNLDEGDNESATEFALTQFYKFHQDTQNQNNQETQETNNQEDT